MVPKTGHRFMNIFVCHKNAQTRKKTPTTTQKAATTQTKLGVLVAVASVLRHDSLRPGQQLLPWVLAIVQLPRRRE